MNDPSPRPRGAIRRSLTGSPYGPDDPEGPRGRPRWTRVAVIVAWVLGVVVVAVVLFVFVFPTRTYLDQRHQLDLAAERLRVLNAENAQLTDEAARLQSPAEIERIAREQYHMVQPGEKAYVILPPPTPPTTAPPPPKHSSQSLWDDLTSLLP